ncbi:bifunctional adenosylcobinamide kinase/adenosylcobinamide-phosphate guanylyltransferase [Metabacillus herbersteinensis]|uniref:Bifunctional adenosylcobinamide kinase/adenosylcobinamide-phosphate guanylyltransferase n=1 Tax=Metabacillus herbersteinensis TaxID=283816 RepID=A0ABV6GDD9_9BACI
MHFISGGAFQGKSKWVKEFYNLEGIPYQWINGYTSEIYSIEKAYQGIFVIEGVERFVRQLQMDYGDQTRIEFSKNLLDWTKWEELSNENKLILIGCDINKGVVPINRDDRLWRDLVGWCYQDIVKIANRVEIVWCGLGEQLK